MVLTNSKLISHFINHSTSHFWFRRTYIPLCASFRRKELVQDDASSHKKWVTYMICRSHQNSVTAASRTGIGASAVIVAVRYRILLSVCMSVSSEYLNTDIGCNHRWTV